MATLVLGAAGAAIGGSIGGSVLGLTSAVIGRAIGATIGQAIDRQIFGQSVMGSGSDLVEQGKIDRFRLSGASEGAGVSEIYAMTRVGGQVIWASRFLETTSDEVIEQETGGKGGGGGGSYSTTVRSYSYSVSLAIALGEGVISHVGRIWADGGEVPLGDLNMRVYQGTDTQSPDPKIEAVEGAANTPAYRGTAYVVIEDLNLERFGNRVPQFSFEVARPTQTAPDPDHDLSEQIRAVAMVPGTGEYALATTKVYLSSGPGTVRPANIHSHSGWTDFRTSVDRLRRTLPAHGATSLVVSWFGSDLRCGSCALAPLVEQKLGDSPQMPWNVTGITRAAAGQVPYLDGRPVYGGTPTDASVREAIADLKVGGRAVMFYPFVLMTQMAGNGLADPWTGAADQPHLPWRGRITLSTAPGQPGTPDGTAAAAAEVAAFFGTAQPGDFALVDGVRTYQGPAEDSYRRFILHYAWLCQDAGGVEAFCIGSEMRGLTQIRGAGNSFPAVQQLISLAADVRAILGPGTKISYAADWSEYFGYRPDDGSGDVFFHLDPLWADPNIDFIGIDNYMPLSDWRDGNDHADAGWGSIYDPDYLRSNIAGGEGFDWYYADAAGRDAQNRLPITDTAHGEDWVFRYKDLANWWSSPHHDRPGGVRSSTPTAWVPQSKPIWFTELGCPAIDKGTNSPNLFYDPKSSESFFPPYSTGKRDDFIQWQYLIAQHTFWDDPANNPTSGVYGAPMVDMARAFVWSWDARPFPAFPNRADAWSDGGNYHLGHWLNGRVEARSLASVVAEICRASGVTDIDTSRLWGLVRGFNPDPGQTARQLLQPLMLAYGFDAVEQGGQIVFRSRHGTVAGTIAPDTLVEIDEVPGGLERTRSPEADTVGRVQVSAVQVAGDYRVQASGTVFPDDQTPTVTHVELPLRLTREEARDISERWLFEARVARDSVRFALPPSRRDLKAGDLVRIDEPGGEALYRIDQVEDAGPQIVEAARVEPQTYGAAEGGFEEEEPAAEPAIPAPVFPVYLDLPLLTGTEVPHAPHIAATADPWPGTAAIFTSPTTDGFRLRGILDRPGVIGETETALPAARPGLYDRGPALRVRLYGGTLASVTPDQLLNGANVAAIGDGASDVWEVFQFANATLVATDTYDLTLRLRGQSGTDPLIPPDWPQGSRFVLLNGALRQPDLTADERGLERNWRIGPASQPVSDDTYLQETRAFAGIGLRPYAPVHLSARPDGAGGHVIAWTRRTRIDGDSWDGMDVPLGEDSESYLVRVFDAGTEVREAQTATPSWTYSAAAQAADGITGAYAVEVAQISDRFGPGLFRRIEIDG